jgi:hypothetical protein
VKLDLLPKYKGHIKENLARWFTQLEEAFVFYLENRDSNKIYAAGSALSGTAAEWFRIAREREAIRLVASNGEPATTWDEFKEMLASAFVQGDAQQDFRLKFYSHVATNIGQGNLRDWTARFRFLAQQILPAMSETDLIFHYGKAMRQATRLQLLGKKDELKTLNAVCVEADRFETNMAGANPMTSGPTHTGYERYRNQRGQNGPTDMDLSVMQERNNGGGRGSSGRGAPGRGRGPEGGRGGRGNQSREYGPPKGKQPLPWVKPEDLTQRWENRVCLSCGSNQHMLGKCPKVLEYNAKQASGNGNRPQEGATQA